MSTHDKDNTFAFLEKAKKQAKRLLKFSKEQDLKITINNLSDAQYWIAKINGYPDWHALNSNLNNILRKQNEEDYIVEPGQNISEKIILPTLKDLYVLENESHLTSFFELSSFPFGEYLQIESWISSFKDKLSFKWNMGFHNIKILFDFFNQEESTNETLSFFEWSEYLGLSKEDFDEIFSINLKPQAKGFCLKVICAINTVKDQADEHISLCKEFKNDFVNREWVYKDEMSLLSFEENKMELSDDASPFYNLSLDKLISNPNYSKNREENLNWLYGIQNLYQKKTPIKLVAHISTDDTKLDILQSKSLDTKFLNGLWTTLNKKIYTTYPKNDELIHLTTTENQTIVPWSKGVPFVNKTDGNTIRIKLNTAYQTSFNNFIYATPGSGKSSLMNVLQLDNISQQLIHNNGKLPLVGIIDVSPSSRGLIDFLKNSLPEEKREEIIYHKWSENDLVNPFDTELGSRYPQPMHYYFLNSFVELLSTSPNGKEEGLTGLIQAAINLVYKNLADNGMPRLYDSRINKNVDSILEKLGYKIDHRTTWWEVVDALFENKYIEEAKIAQTYVSPLLSDITIALQDDSLRDIYGRITTSTGESLIQYLNRTIIDAMNSMPYLNQPTKFSFGNERIICVDLDNSMKAGGYASHKKGAINYLLASFVLAKHMNIYMKEVINYPHDIAPAYQEYFKKQKDIQRELVSLCFDELHRASSFEPVTSILSMYFRESRKYGNSFTVATQTLENMEALSGFSSNHFIFTSNLYNDSNIKNVVDLLGIKDSNIISYLKRRKNYEMGEILYKTNTNLQGNIEKIINFKINPFVLWIITGILEDSIVREKISQKLGYIETIKLLTNKYPYGVKKIFEQRKESAVVNGNKEPTFEEIIQQIINET
jgi:hypothetical protein